MATENRGENAHFLPPGAVKESLLSVASGQQLFAAPGDNMPKGAAVF
jgi:hypothetical protein